MTAYHENFYGVLEDGLNAGDSDRVVLRWDLASDRAVRAAKGPTEAPRLDEGRVVLGPDANGEPAMSALSGDVLLAWLPESIVAIREYEPERANAWRLALRDTVGRALADGFTPSDHPRRLAGVASMKLEGVELRRISHAAASRRSGRRSGPQTERDVLLAARRHRPTAEGWGECVAMSASRCTPREYVDGAADVIRTLPAAAAARRAATSTRGGGAATAATPFKGHRMAKARAGDGRARRRAARRRAGRSAATSARPATGCRAASRSASWTASRRCSTRSSGYLAEGYVRIKLKIEPGWDVEPVRAVRERFGDDVLLQVDANTAYTLARRAAPRPARRVRPAADRAAAAEEDVRGHAELAKLDRDADLPRRVDRLGARRPRTRSRSAPARSSTSSRAGSAATSRRAACTTCARRTASRSGAAACSRPGSAAPRTSRSPRCPASRCPATRRRRTATTRRTSPSRSCSTTGTSPCRPGPGLGVTPIPEVLEQVTTSVETCRPRPSGSGSRRREQAELQLEDDTFLGIVEIEVEELDERAASDSGTCWGAPRSARLRVGHRRSSRGTRAASTRRSSSCFASCARMRSSSPRVRLGCSRLSSFSSCRTTSLRTSSVAATVRPRTSRAQNAEHPLRVAPCRGTSRSPVDGRADRAEQAECRAAPPRALAPVPRAAIKARGSIGRVALEERVDDLPERDRRRLPERSLRSARRRGRRAARAGARRCPALRSRSRTPAAERRRRTRSRDARPPRRRILALRARSAASRHAVAARHRELREPGSRAERRCAPPRPARARTPRRGGRRRG